jgi:nitrate reductase gamma subunit
VIYWSGANTLHRGAFVGFICWLGFMAAPLFAETNYEKRPYKLFAINSGYWLVSMLLSGVVLAVWR